jgi:guanylate kinase
VLVIDVQGAKQVRAKRAGTIGIFVLPPTFAILEERLRGRSKDAEPQIQRRLQVARQEVGAVADYDYVVVNDDLEPAVARLTAIVEAERARLHRMEPVAARIIETFR